MKKRLFEPENLLQKEITPHNAGGADGMRRITGVWELAVEEGYDEQDAPDGWDEKRCDAVYSFGGDGTGRYLNGTAELDFAWRLEGDTLTVAPIDGTEPATHTVSIVDAETMLLEFKIKDDAGPYWKHYNRATYIKKG